MSDTGPVVGGYQLVGRVGSGSTASVWKAMDPGLGRAVALKQVPAAAVELLRAEYLVEDWIDGATLSEVLAAGGRLSVPQALGVVRGSLLGLAHAHSRGIVHGDVSASNIFVDVEGTSRLIDFGLGGSAPAHRSPEAAAGGPLSPVSDVYAAAVVLVHLLTAQGSPGAGPDLGKVDQGLRSVLGTALAHDPASRYADAAAFLAGLEEAAERTYGAAWSTSDGVGALVAPAVATLVPVGNSSLAGDGAVGGAVAAAATGRRVPWKMLVGAGIASLAVVGGPVTAVALTGGDDSSEEDRGPAGGGASDDGEQGEDEKDGDPVVDTVPRGKFTYRQVLTKSDDPTWAKVGQTAEGIWTITADCPSADDCRGTIKDAAGGSSPLTWDGTVLTQAAAAGTVTRQCTDTVTGEPRGPFTLRRNFLPTPIVYAPSGAVDPDTGLASTYTGTYTFTERIVSYNNTRSGPSRPRDCPFRSNGQIEHSATYEVTITRGADPKVAKAERRRPEKAKGQEGEQRTAIIRVQILGEQGIGPDRINNGVS